MSTDGHSFEDVETLIHKTAIPAAEKLVFDSRKRDEFWIISLYCSSIELASACVALVDRKVGYHAFALLRQFLEINVDIRLLIQDPAYVNQLIFEDLQSKKQTLKHAQNGNPYLEHIARLPNLDNMIAQNKAELSALGKQGLTKQFIKEKFHNADMEEVYNGLYRQLSSHTHSNFGALVSRHIAMTEGKPRFHAFRHGSRRDFAAVSTALYDNLRDISDEVHTRFGAKFPEAPAQPGTAS